MPLTPETCVWLLRHGASTFNLQHRCQGSSDEPELTLQGREEARLSGERKRDVERLALPVAFPLRSEKQAIARDVHGHAHFFECVVLARGADMQLRGYFRAAPPSAFDEACLPVGQTLIT